MATLRGSGRGAQAQITNGQIDAAMCIIDAADPDLAYDFHDDLEGAQTQESRQAIAREMLQVADDIKRQGSKATAQPAEHTGRRGIEWGTILIASVGWVVGGVFWIIGARYTIDGVAIGVNWLCQFLHIPVKVALPLPWQMYLGLILIPLAASLIEVKHRPAKKVGQRRVWPAPQMLCLWVLVAAADMATTLLAVTNPSPDAWSITRWMASQMPVAAIWIVFLTFWPEWMIDYMGTTIKRAVRTR